MKKSGLICWLLAMVIMISGCGSLGIGDHLKNEIAMASSKETDSGLETDASVESRETPESGIEETETPAEAKENTEGAETAGGNDVITETEGTPREEVPTGSPGLTFVDLSDLEFFFASGAGGWATVLYINEDGSFYGNYHDSDMGSMGEGYPHGTIYYCDFTGRFSAPVQVNDYTYSMQIEELTYAQDAGTEEIRDETLYVYSDAYGLNDAKDILIYLPGAPLDQLPLDFRSWIGYYDLSLTTDTTLPFYALNNENMQYGFSSSSRD